MLEFDLLHIRKSAREEIADLFDRLADGLFVSVPEEKIPEHGLKDDPNVTAWEGEIDCGGRWVKIKIALPSTFPDNLPRIYLCDLPAEIPHVTAKREYYVCSISRDEVFLNTKNPKLIVLETLHAVSRVISDGLNGHNYNDFDLEFQAYWRQGAEIFWLSLISPEGESREVAFLHFKPAIGPYSYVLADTKEEAETWLSNCGREVIDDPDIALYIPLKQSLRPPFPVINREVYRTLRAIDEISLHKLCDYLTKYQKSFNRVIFSFDVLEHHTFGGWIHTRPPSSSKRTICPGFRNNRIPWDQQLISCLGNTNIRRAKVERVDVDRFQARVGHDDVSSISTKHVLIVGCGSIGGKIALLLSMSGVGELTLIDKETLSFENIARHIAPMSAVGINKVNAVAQCIHAKMPNTKINPESCDFYEVLARGPSWREGVDLVISATADRNLNLRINELQVSVDRAFATLYVWIEAFGYASHAILITPRGGGCLHCTFGTDDFDYRHRVITLPASAVLRQEAGCESTFQPYSAIDADLAATTAVRLALSYFYGEMKQSVRWVYLGDLEAAKARKIPLSSEYETSGSNKLIKNTLASRFDCPICRKELA